MSRNVIDWQKKYGLSPRYARNFSQMTEEQRLMYLFSRLEKAEKSNEDFKYKSRMLANVAEMWLGRK